LYIIPLTERHYILNGQGAPASCEVRAVRVHPNRRGRTSQ
jgi:hypothetical protein